MGELTTSAILNVYNEKSRAPFVYGRYNDAFEAYSASKVAALNDTKVWLEREKASISFNVINIFPSFVLGRNELVPEFSDVIQGTNKIILGSVTGIELSCIPSTSAHVRDVTLAQVKCPAPKIPGNQGYILKSGGLEGTHWEDLLDIIANKFPIAAESDTLSNNGKIITVPINIDESASEKILGYNFHSF